MSLYIQKKGGPDFTHNFLTDYLIVSINIIIIIKGDVKWLLIVKSIKMVKQIISIT